jgi:hypothetical protein
MFEPKLAAERKVSFERDGLDASKACHISERGSAAAGLQGMEAPSQKHEDWRRVICQCCFKCFHIKLAKRRVSCLSDSEVRCQARNHRSSLPALCHEVICAN